MTDKDPPPELVEKAFEAVKRATTERMLDEGVVKYWQHDPRQVGAAPHAGQPWAYTVGRTMHGRPELLVTGLGEAHSLALLTELEDQDVSPDVPVVTTAVGRVAFVRAEPGYLHAAYAVFGQSYSALQIVWEGAGEQPLHLVGGLILTDPYPRGEREP